MRLARMHAGGKGIQAADAVGQPCLDQKIQCAIGDGGLVAETFGGKALQHVIGAQRAVFLQQDFQHAAADGGQPRALFLRDPFGACQRITCTMGMVMPREGQIRRGASRAILPLIVGMVMRHGASPLTCYSITYIAIAT